MSDTFDKQARIHDAASLLVVTKDKPYHVLMGQRPKSARFMPGYYVFPGGAIEPQDLSVPLASHLSDDDVRLMRVTEAAQA